MRHLHHWRIALFVLLGLGSSWQSAHAEHLTRCEAAIEASVQKVRSEFDRDKRIDLSTELAFQVRAYPNCAQYPRIVDDIAALLDDPADGVRMGAAMALGYIGPPAMRAVPALKRTIKQLDDILDADSTDPVLPVDSSGEEAREAVRKITGEKIPGYQEAREN
jgi:HEAT repeat protein